MDQEWLRFRTRKGRLKIDFACTLKLFDFRGQPKRETALRGKSGFFPQLVKQHLDHTRAWQQAYQRHRKFTDGG
ncbi:MAG: hypothetical protein KJ947_11545 [Alphaproteobacteria bacterium]|nr:hypothetical protein [Alphaproteobacteria bacterium]MBU1550190.1 hypothetical protein [Alphaproteobacteria bacterium]MBU2337889.1 hypothetical protein [Alphaproteobacteria bacterium]MBU2387869.1 hypothetical protein [Alphaproteobacteria bacterium]